MRKTGCIKRRFFVTADWTVRRGMVPVGGIAAVCAYASMHLAPWLLFLLAGVGLISVLLPPLRRVTWLFAVAVAALFLVSGGLYRLRQVEPLRAYEDTTAVITARVLEVSSPSSALMQVTAAENLPCGTRLFVYFSQENTPSVQDTVCGEVRLKALFPTQSNRRADGVFLQAVVTSTDEGALTVTAAEASLFAAMERLRSRLVQTMRTALTGEEGALLAGLCLGDLDGISQDTEMDFRRAGLPHILVVSGLHLSVISAGVYGACRLLIRRRDVRVAVAMVLTVFFMLLVGLTPSVARAGIVCLVLFSGQLFRRRADGLNSLGLALALLVAYNPYCLLDRGLLLSFGAAGGVLCLTKPLCARLCCVGLWKPLASALSVTLAASLPIMPLLAATFKEVSVVSPMANLLAVAPSSVAMILGCLGLLVCWCAPLLPMAEGLWLIAGWIMRWVMAVARFFGNLSFATAPTVRLWVTVCLTGACTLSILSIWSKKSGVLRRVLAALLVLFCMGGWLSKALARDSVRVMASVYDGAVMLVIEQDGRRGVFVENAAGLYADNAVQVLCHDGVDFLVIGDGEPVDAACVTAFVHQYPTRRLLVAGDMSWAAGLPLMVEPLTEKTRLWSDVTVAAEPDGGWRLVCCGTSLVISPQSEALTADGVIFSGALPTASADYAVGQGLLFADGDDVAAVEKAAALPYPTATVARYTRVYLTTRGNGEWSFTRWL